MRFGGGVLVDQGKLDEALKAYRDSLAIRERLAAADRSNMQWQRDLSVSYERVGGVLMAHAKPPTRPSRSRPPGTALREPRARAHVPQSRG
jgi:hypothetical protein